MPGSGPIQGNTRPPSEMEMVKEIHFLKLSKAAGTNELPPSFLKVGVNKISGKRRDPQELECVGCSSDL